MLFGIRKTKCKCGHEGIEHYDSWSFCTWMLSDECDCEKFEPVEPENIVTFESDLKEVMPD